MIGSFSWTLIPAAVIGAAFGYAFVVSLRHEVSSRLEGALAAIIQRFARLFAVVAVFGLAVQAGAATLIATLAAFHVGALWALFGRAKRI